jgi:transcriptional regulator with XRE-family HTH domain
MDNALFAGLLRDILNSRGINQKWLADETGATEATISRYMAGKHQPEINIVVAISKALGVSMDYLCGLTDLQTPKESLGAELHLLMRCYKRADIRDKKIMWTMLERYMTAEEKEGPFSSSFAEKPDVKTG